MQNIGPIPQTLTGAFWFVVATFVASLVGGTTIVGIVKLILWRNKPAAEIHEVEARTAKTFAESKQIELQANIDAGDAVLRMVQQLVFTQAANEQLHRDNERLENENERYETQMRRAKALLKLHNVRFELEGEEAKKA